MSEKKFNFIVEWYDTQSSVLKKFNFTYFLKESSIELFDLKNKKIFLKKIFTTEIKHTDIFIGAVLTVFSRQLQFVEYADVFTKNYYESLTEKTFAMIKPDAYLNIGKVIAEIEAQGLQIGNIRMTQMTEKDAGDFYAEHKGKPFYDGLVKQMSSDLIVGIEIIGPDAVKKWRDIMGPTDPNKARQTAPNSLRARFGIAGPKNSTHGSDGAGSAARELDFFFNNKSQLKSTAVGDNCSLLIIRPHIVKQKQVGAIIDQVLSSGFEVSALQMFYLDHDTSNEFYEVYKGVLPEYANLAEHLTIGPCVALEVRRNNIVHGLRELCGPFDPEIAKVLRPNTIRAKFGTDRVKNAVHCTDLEEDGQLEVSYFFNTLMTPGWKRV